MIILFVIVSIMLAFGVVFYFMHLNGLFDAHLNRSFNNDTANTIISNEMQAYNPSQEPNSPTQKQEPYLPGDAPAEELPTYIFEEQEPYTELEYVVRVIFIAESHTPSLAEMYNTKQIMNRRLQSIGIDGLATLKLNDNQIIFDINPFLANNIEQLIAEISVTGMLMITDEQGNWLLYNPHIQSAQAQIQGNENVVSIQFTEHGTQLLVDATRANIGRPLLIFFDDEFISSVVVQTVIEDGTAVISGNFSQEETANLAGIIQMGALSVRLAILSADIKTTR